jgi:sulfopyruvate decarboxylase subunit alpha
MFEADAAVKMFQELGVTHVIWLPDSELGRWDERLRSAARPKLVRVCREGEAFGIAAGVALGGGHPVVVIQCTGFFEAGDALRNVVHDMALPIFIIVGYRGFYTAASGRRDTAATFIEPIVRAWQLPYKVFGKDAPIEELAEFYRTTQADGKAAAALLAETRM